MNCRNVASKLTLIVPLTALTALSACGLFSSKSVGLSKVDNLVTWIERVHVDSELAKERVHIALRALHILVAPDFSGDLVTAYSDFVTAIELSEAQAQELHTSFAAMQEASVPVFEQWEEDLTKFKSETMRKRSGDRLVATKQRYQMIATATGPAVTTFDHFNQSIRDHALFLGHDFNAAAIAEIDEDIRELTQMSGKLREQLDTCQKAARLYVESAALPLHVGRTLATPQRRSLNRMPINDGKNLEEQRRKRLRGTSKR